jgi:uncharacterized protein YdhG (YjbR/CyaY superfamily)
MMANRPTAGSIDEYIAGFPPEAQQALEELRALIRECAPEATETISYAIPTFDLNGHHLVHFAGHAKHIGFYPVPSAMQDTRKPALTSLIDDREAEERSVAELKTLPIRMVFPRHGKPFPIDRLALR